MDKKKMQWFLNAGGTGFTSEYQAVINKAIALGYALPSPTHQAKQNAFMLALKNAGILSHLDALRVYKYANNLNFAAIDWINPEAELSLNINSPGFDDSKGVIGDGVSSYIDSKVDLSSIGHYSVNDASMFAFFGDTISSGVSTKFGVYEVGISFSTYTNAGSTYPLLNSIATNDGSLYTTPGLTIIQRLNEFGVNFIQNGVSHPQARPVGTIPFGSVFIQARNDSGTPVTFSSEYTALFGVGDGLSGLESALKTVTDNFYAS